MKRIIWISWACGATAWFLRSVSVEEIVTVYHSAGDKEREGFALVSLAQHLLRNLVLNLSSLRIWKCHFFQSRTWSLKSDWFGKASFQTCYEENHFVLKQKLKPELDSCTPRPLCGLDAHLDCDDFFWDSEAAVISLENAQQTRLYYLWNVMKHFHKISKCLLPYWEKHTYSDRVIVDVIPHTHTPFVFARTFSYNTIMSSKVHSIRTDQDFVNAEKVATAADFIFKGIHDKAAKHARCASRECHDSWQMVYSFIQCPGRRASGFLKSSRTEEEWAWETARYVGYGFSFWVRTVRVTAS